MALNNFYSMTQIEVVKDLYPLTLGMTFIAILFLALSYNRKIPRYNLKLIGIGLSVLGLFIFTAAMQYTDKGVDQSVLFHLQNGGEGVNFYLIAPILKIFLYYFLPYFALFFWIAKSQKKQKTKELNSYFKTFFPLLIIGAILLNPAYVQLAGIGAFHLQGEKHRKEMAAYTQTEVSEIAEHSKETPSFLYIYAESLERSFYNEELFPGMMPNIQELTKEGLQFTKLGEASMTGWTIAGQIASQCGTPTTSKASNPLMFEKSCVGYYLKNRGYQLEYLNGGSLDFAGKGLFWKANHYQTYDGDSIAKSLNKKTTQKNIWGEYDSIVFEGVLQKLQDLKKSKKPFVLTTLTLDTHPPEGFPSPQCKGIPELKIKRKIGQWDNMEKNYLATWHCADKMLSDLIKEVRKEHPDIYIVLSSDHLMMGRSFNFLNNKERYNTWVMWGPDVEPIENNRAGTTLDIAPTFLSLAGIPTQKMGLGRNLLNEAEPTLVEKLGLNQFNIKIESTYTLGTETPFYGTRKNQMEINTNEGEENLNKWEAPKRNFKNPAIQ